MDDRQERVRIGEEIISNIRYADDTTILAENLQDLQTFVNLVGDNFNIFIGNKINISKTKWMAVGKINIDHGLLSLNGEEIERVNHFKYLGSWLNVNYDYDVSFMTCKPVLPETRGILKVSLVSHTSNEDVLKMMNSEHLLINIIKKRKTEYFEHIIRGRNYHRLRLIIQGKID